MGPDALRTAGLGTALRELGHGVEDLGNLAPAPVPALPDGIRADLHGLTETIGWTRSIAEAAEHAMARGLPIFMGGDHALSLGSVSGVMRHAQQADRPLFVLWLDAHSDIHSPASTQSGHLHGTPLGYVTGQPGFDGFPDLPGVLPPERIAMIGLRSVDASERQILSRGAYRLTDMRRIDEGGISGPLSAFLSEVSAANGLLHVSLDVDFLDPEIAPAVGTTVPGGATAREGHLVMEMLSDSGLVTSLDLVELNPFLDDRGRTASLMVDLTASLMGRRIYDRPTRSFA